MKTIYIAFLIAVSVAYLVTPFVIKLANRVGAIDVPKDSRRVHTVPIPRLGGIAIFIGFMVAVLTTLKMDTRLMGVLAGAVIIVTMGYFDDIKPLSAKVKLLVQLLAAGIAMYGGVKMNILTNPLSLISGTNDFIVLGKWSYPLTMVWIVGVTNAINLIDGLDGLAAGVSTIAALTLTAVALFTGDTYISMLAAILAGATIGFLPYNFNPAKIFMGDTGSLLLGYMLSVISIMGVLKSAAALSILIPIFAIGLPIFDTFMAIVRRGMSGKSFMEADKGHLHHRLLDIGLSQKQAVLTLYSISAVLGFGAVALVEATLKVAIVLVIAVFFLASMGVKYLGLTETKTSDSNIDV
ncbi:MAG: undecaprenyl-phosphate alpha-N-acetylglucosaminyl 1-phosphate transferase [Clostridiales bacterium GWB2_37_7]|nr:MAG: undecaprenyl-phosphate alpha-N-acetylglucosaminyl 1-phosphate transferase [Clostridiales bacterium GWB2_37_7]